MFCCLLPLHAVVVEGRKLVLGEDHTWRAHEIRPSHETVETAVRLFAGTRLQERVGETSIFCYQEGGEDCNVGVCCGKVSDPTLFCNNGTRNGSDTSKCPEGNVSFVSSQRLTNSGKHRVDANRQKKGSWEVVVDDVAVGIPTSSFKS